MSNRILTTRGYLSQALYLDKDIQSKLTQVQAYRELAMRSTSKGYDTSRSDSPDLQIVDSLIAKITDKEREIDKAIDALIELKTEIENSIAGVETTKYRQLLALRYLCFLTWDSVGAQLDYSGRHARRVHELALKEFEKLVRPCPCMSGVDVQL